MTNSVQNLNQVLDQGVIQNNFNRAAKNYDFHAKFFNLVADNMLDVLQLFKIPPQNILDLGCGTGNLIKSLHNIYSKANINGIDFANNMLQIAKLKNPNTKFILGNLNNLPIKKGSYDLIVSNLSVNWCLDLPNLINEVYRALKPSGVFLFSTYGPNTLYELKKSWLAIDDHPHINPFMQMESIGDILLHNKFIEPVVNQEYIDLKFSSIGKLFEFLKYTGQTNAHSARYKGLLTPAKLKRLEVEYKKEFTANNNNKLNATFEIVYGHAKKNLAAHIPDFPTQIATIG